MSELVSQPSMQRPRAIPPDPDPEPRESALRFRVQNLLAIGAVVIQPRRRGERAVGLPR